MINFDKDFLTLGADIGGKDAFGVINPHVLALRALLRQGASGLSCDPIREIALVLRVDGSVQAWGKRGVENISLLKKKTFVTADIFVPIDVWSKDESISIRQFLFDQVAHAIRLIVEYVNRQGVALEGSALEEALANVKLQYLN
jgi:hypothetical protein